MNETRRPWLGVTVAGAITLMLVAPQLVPLAGASEPEPGIALSIALLGLIAGVLVARRPDHPISWMLAATAFFGGVAGLSAELLPAGTTELTWWQTVLAIVSGPAWYALLFMVLVMIPLVFPTGSPPSPRWRWLAWVTGSAVAVMGVWWTVQERFCTDWDAEEVCIDTVANPIGISGVANPEESALIGFLFLGLLLGAALALTSLIIRFRRSGALERQQIKWVAFSCGLFIAYILIDELVLVKAFGAEGPPGYALVDQLQWLLIPASIAVAILRYRLYDIDRLISRTVAYALIAGVLAAVYAAVVVGIQAVLPNSGDLAVAASTLTAVALFSPLQRRVRQWMDRRFNRRRYVAEKVVEEFSARLRNAVDLDDVTGDLLEVVTTTVEPTSATVWLR